MEWESQFPVFVVAREPKPERERGIERKKKYIKKEKELITKSKINGPVRNPKISHGISPF